MATRQNLVVALLACIALVALLALYMLRCEASPPIGVNALSFATVVLGVSLAVVHWGLADPDTGISRKLQLTLLSFGVALFISALAMMRYAVNYSDAIGRPHGFQSAGLQCRGLQKAQAG